MSNETQDRAEDAEPPPGARKTIVWLISSRTTRDGVKGTLTMTTQGLLFSPTSGAPETLFRHQEVKRAHRVMTSPVLELKLSGDHPRLVGLYFIEPPPLTPPGPQLFGRRRARRQAVTTLIGSNASRRDLIDEWVRRIREQGSGQEG
jgi:hypothetical protein